MIRTSLGTRLAVRASTTPRGDVDVVRLEMSIDGGDWISAAAGTSDDGGPSSDDVARLNDEAFGARHRRAVAAAVAANGGAPVEHYGVFGGDSTSTSTEADVEVDVVVSHCPVEACGLLRPTFRDAPLDRALAVVPGRATLVAKLVQSATLARSYFADTALGFDVSPLNASPKPTPGGGARVPSRRAPSRRPRLGPRL